MNRGMKENLKHIFQEMIAKKQFGYAWHYKKAEIMKVFGLSSSECTEIMREIRKEIPQLMTEGGYWVVGRASLWKVIGKQKRKVKSIEADINRKYGVLPC